MHEHEREHVRLLGGGDAVVHDGAAATAASAHRAALRGVAGHLLERRGGQRGSMRRHCASPRHAHRHQLLSLQPRAQRSTSTPVW